MILEDKQIPALNGLVLAGGKSIRMGTDKDLIKWHGKEQRYYAVDLLKKFCADVFISCRPQQEYQIDKAYKTLPDSFLAMGPFGGILSALRAERDRAWLVVACDLPLLNAKTVEFLISNRNSKVNATTYESPHDGLPEPLITIWEPGSYPVLLDFLGRGITCPRKVLLNTEKAVLKPLYPDALMNVNTPEDAVIAKQKLAER